MKNHLDAGHFLRTFAWSEEEEKRVAGYPLLTRKPLILVLNIGEEQLSGSDLADRIGRRPLMWAAWIIGLLATWLMAIAHSLPVFVTGMIL